MQTDRDFQKQRVYNWEAENLSAMDTTTIAFDNAQNVVDYVWASMGLKFPPKVLPLATHRRKAQATGGRGFIHIRPQVSNRMLLHELAHSMTASHDATDGHGPQFVGIYYKLLERFMGVPGPLMMYTLNKAGVKFDLAAQPWCS